VRQCRAGFGIIPFARGPAERPLLAVRVGRVEHGEDQSQALLVLTAPPDTEGYEKLQLLAVLGHQTFAEAGRS
jgi:hypothetical protein